MLNHVKSPYQIRLDHRVAMVRSPCVCFYAPRRCVSANLPGILEPLRVLESQLPEECLGIESWCSQMDKM